MVIVSDFDLIKDLYKKYEASGRPIQKPFHEARFGSADGTQRGILQSTGHNGFFIFKKLSISTFNQQKMSHSAASFMFSISIMSLTTDYGHPMKA